MRTILENLDTTTSETFTGKFDKNGKKIYQKEFDYSLNGGDQDYLTDILSTYKILKIYGIISNGSYYFPTSYYTNANYYYFQFIYFVSGKINISNHCTSQFAGYTVYMTFEYTK